MTGILVAGTSSDAGKSLVVTALCRVARRRARVGGEGARDRGRGGHRDRCRGSAEHGRRLPRRPGA